MKSDVRFYHINNQYMAYIELRENWIIIGIALKCKWLLFIPDYKIVSWYKLFLIVNDDYKSDRTTGCCIEMGIRNRVVSLIENIRNMGTFNLKSEIDSLYQEYLKSLKSQETKAKLIDNIFNSLDNEKN